MRLPPYGRPAPRRGWLTSPTARAAADLPVAADPERRGHPASRATSAESALIPCGEYGRRER